MLSKKMAFSLMSLITIFALAFVVPSALAADGGPTVTISTKDHSNDDGKQVIPTEPETATPATIVGDTVVVTIEFSDVVDFNYTAGTPVEDGTNAFDPEVDVMFLYTNNDGVEQAASTTEPTWVQKNGKKYEGTVTLAADNTKVIVWVDANAATAITGKTQGKGNQASGAYNFSIIMKDDGKPYPVRMKRLPPSSGFMSDKVTGPFDVKIVLSEKPKEGKFTKAQLGIKNGSLGTVIPGGSIERYKYLMMNEDDSFDLYDTDADGDNNLGTASDTITAATFDTAEATKDLMPMATGNDMKFYRYKVTITPDFKDDKVIVWVKDFVDNALDPANTYSLVGINKVPDDLPDKKRKLVINVDQTGRKPVATPGMSVGIPGDTIIPAGGYLVIVRDDGDGANEAEKSSESLIIHPGDRKEANPAGSGRSVVKQSYNVVPADLKYDLEGFLTRGGTIDLIAPDAGVMISEIMWATDGGETNRQWIEIHNMGSTQITTSGYKLMLYTANEALPNMTDATLKIKDRVSTLYKGTNHWSIAGKGQSGQTAGVIERSIGEGEDVDIDIEVVQTSRLVSMERVMDTAGMYADGTMDTSWAASVPPSSNFMDAAGGLFVGSPGASPINPVADPVPAPEPTPAPVIPVAMKDDIKITEIMVDTGNGRLPQWIELNNVSMKEVSLAGWSLEIENAAADADAIGRKLSIDLMGTLGVSAHTGNTGQGQSLLLVSWAHRSSSNLQDHKRIKDVSSEVGGKGRYKLISDMAFMITLVPPQTTGLLTYGDMAGNLGAAEAWEIPMSENGRSSLIRREMLSDGMATMGTSANGWMLASSTTLTNGPATWYGSDEDSGTPGYDAGGPLPVELSHFRPARDKATGAVVITWATQSELNNAGFFIKRSQQRDGQFQVINATMVAGAGTTSEKQFYTYTDTTAQPNVVYYYQIEDVSLDGQRQTLTRGIRLKGHIGAAGKATTLWGELKSSNE